MTDNNHPITPPPELVEQWECEYHHMTYGPDLSIFISEKAARWGADQELEACCEILRGEFNYHHLAEPLRDARRPKPPSLKEQALKAATGMADCMKAGLVPKCTDLDLIRHALEALPD